MTFFAALDSFMTPALAQIIQLPILRPVFVREMSSKMYSPSAYYLAGWLISTLSLLAFPIVTSAVSFNSLEFNQNNFRNYLNWMGTLMLCTLQGSTFGFMLGCIYDDIETGANILTAVISMLTFGCGIYVNLKTAHWYIKLLGYISPFRYLIERLMRVMLAGLSYAD